MRQISIPGRYNANVSLAEIRQSEQSGAYYLYLEFSTDEDEFTTKRLYLSEKAIEFSVKNLNDAFDFDGEFSTIERQLVGKPCRIVVVESETEDNKRFLEVKYINRSTARDNLANSDAISKLSSLAKEALSSKNANNPF